MSSGAQPSSASANISFRKQAWSPTNTAAANSSAMIQENPTSEDSTATPQAAPYCGTFTPTQPTTAASQPSSTTGGGGGGGGSGGGNSYSGDVTTSGPLNFPPPRFAAGRKIKSYAGDGFTLVSHVTNRSWKTIKSLRECQFGEVFLAVEVTRASNAGWGRVSTTPAKYFAIKVGARNSNEIILITSYRYLFVLLKIQKNSRGIENGCPDLTSPRVRTKGPLYSLVMYNS